MWCPCDLAPNPSDQSASVITETQDVRHRSGWLPAKTFSSQDVQRRLLRFHQTRIYNRSDMPTHLLRNGHELGSSASLILDNLGLGDVNTRSVTTMRSNEKSEKAMQEKLSGLRSKSTNGDDPPQSKFREILERVSDSEHRQSWKEEQPQGVAHVSAQDDADSDETNRDSLSAADEAAGVDQFRLQLNTIRHRRRQFEAYLRSMDFTELGRQLVPPGDINTSPEVCTPSWFVKLLENGVSLNLKPELLIALEDTTSQTESFAVIGSCMKTDSSINITSANSDSPFNNSHSWTENPRYTNDTQSSGPDVISANNRRVRMALCKRCLVSDFRRLGYSSLALSSPVLFVAEEMSDGPESMIALNGENEINVETAWPARRADDIFQGKEHLSSAELTSHFRHLDSKLGHLVQDKPNLVWEQKSRTDQALCNDGIDTRLSLKAKCIGRGQCFITHSACVTQCAPSRIVISGSFPTIQWGHLPFQLIMFPCKKSQSVKGSFTRKSCESNIRLRWRF
ncbi:hypothetical protein PoB_002429300 [Plakobranchus ocellatus]|uniref:Uncharacterized protein n=1 Tax=Plakobranchus ocellatus TaxID=259542 RepID=A0AAV3ZSG7_9GAST|nr:hypothetical protein PoB_002429300 [Plakobranchus ocellatus]